MSTRSRIGIIREQGSPPIVESIYCHFDGYPEGVGQTLLNHWTDTEKINRLIALGDLSVLGSEIGEDQGTDWFDEQYKTLQAADRNDPRHNWCVAYGRDRGEKECVSRTHSMYEFPDCGQEAEYVFHPGSGKWWVSSPGQNPVGWNTVAAWHGFISIPDAIEIEQRNMARLG